ncbi:MAG TPA: UDP-N-acetylmuramate--L-alanine ligase [Vicinamibacterales bacterium]|nr:UDP-N-acetylmuramate--L-alanine ligase [Vicinamibacterales bacterium]
MLGQTKRIHFVGIGGIGMSGIAELLVNLGYEVSGSDARASDITARLARLGVSIHTGEHAAHHVGTADVVVVSSAIGSENPEVAAARARGIPVIPRAEMLAELMRLQRGIAVAGAHGKTTTTSMIALVLERAGLDPTAVIGGRLSAFGSNARLGRGAYIVAEADESDRSFLRLSPVIALITNLDREHMEAYGTFEEIERAFAEFASRVPFDGLVVACADDPALRAMLPSISRPVVTYALDAPADLTATGVALQPFASVSQVWLRTPAGRVALGTMTLSVPGRHNVANALGAVAVGLELKIPFDRIAAALAEFHGAERRFERLGEVRDVMVVDDYGHHPTEIAAVIAAARPIGRRTLVVFQPHRYTRTQQLMGEFGPALAGADEIVLTDIYPASEKPIEGVTLDALAAAVRRVVKAPVHVVAALDELPARVAALARPGDVVITLGAGSIGTVGRRLLEELRR